LERNLFAFILRHSKRDQLLIVPLVFASMAVYYLSLDLPKMIINEPIQGKRFPDPDSTAQFLRIAFKLPEFLGGQTVRVFDGFPLEQLPYLFALTLTFLGLIVLNGFIRFQINTMKGWMGERMLRRLRYALFDQLLRFPLQRFRRVKSAEMSSMIKDEVEPLGGFIGEAFITPARARRRGADGAVLHPVPASGARADRVRDGHGAGGRDPEDAAPPDRARRSSDSSRRASWPAGLPSRWTESSRSGRTTHPTTSGRKSRRASGASFASASSSTSASS
jgi:ABC-type multidrug transport system fused ATPase/permease subunit